MCLCVYPSIRTIKPSTMLCKLICINISMHQRYPCSLVFTEINNNSKLSLQNYILLTSSSKLYIITTCIHTIVVFVVRFILAGFKAEFSVTTNIHLLA